MTKTKSDLDAPLAHDAEELLKRLDFAIGAADMMVKELAKRVAKFRSMRKEVEATVKPPRKARQLVWQQERIAAGLCSSCGNEKICRERSTRFGKKCLQKQADKREEAKADKILEG